MNHNGQFNRDIVFNAPSFIAVIHYKRAEKALYLVLRSRGQRYRYDKVPVNVFNELMDANNKGSYISLNILHNDKYTCTKLDPIPMATLERITMPASKKYWLGR